MSEIHGSVGSYVVNALDDGEKDEFEAHLDTCPTCRREVVEFSETAAQLGSLVETPPPPALRASVMSAIREVRPLPPELPEVSAEDSGAAVAVASPSAPVVDELAVRRARRTARLLALAVAAAMVVALGLGGWVVNLVQDRQAQSAEATLETQLMTAPDVKYYQRTIKGAPVTFVVSKSLDKALMIGNNVPSPGDQKQYQLWTLTNHAQNAVPDNVFDGGQARKTWLAGSVKTADGIAVTVEPHGGRPKPSNTTQTMVTF